MRIDEARPGELASVMPLVAALWPDDSAELLSDLLTAKISGPEPGGTLLVARAESGEVVGFAFVTLRGDYVNGCDNSPVAFLEGIYVAPASRLTAVGRALAATAENWGRARGACEFASDALIDNVDSHAFHRKLGFAETERVVYFRKLLEEASA